MVVRHRRVLTELAALQLLGMLDAIGDRQHFDLLVFDRVDDDVEVGVAGFGDEVGEQQNANVDKLLRSLKETNRKIK